ncbi:MAG: diguanylate cyclase [Planctomycetota bacterium]
MTTIRVLVAEDDLAHQRLLARAFERPGYAFDVTFVRDRDAVLDALQTDCFDCMVLDFNLPPHTAIDLLRDVKRWHDDAALIVISSSEDQRVVISSLREGVADFIPKEDAVKGDALARCTKRAVEKQAASRAERRAINRRMLELERAAATDTLTGLGNRRYVERMLEANAASDRREFLGLAIFDIDRFKSVNDTYGHDAGDAVIAEVGAILNAHAGASDVVARWGGEEFVAIRQSSTVPGMFAWAERVRHDIATRLDHGIVPDRITASCGVDVVRTRDVRGIMFCRADRALYAAKRSGRDRVCTLRMADVFERASIRNSDPCIAST